MTDLTPLAALGPRNMHVQLYREHLVRRMQNERAHAEHLRRIAATPVFDSERVKLLATADLHETVSRIYGDALLAFDDAVDAAGARQS